MEDGNGADVYSEFLVIKKQFQSEIFAITQKINHISRQGIKINMAVCRRVLKLL